MIGRGRVPMAQTHQPGARQPMNAVARRTAVACIALAVMLSASRGSAEGLAPGSELSKDNWQEAKGLLPDEFLECYQRGDFRDKISDWSVERFGDDPVFREALNANRGRYDVTEDGSIIDTHTGQPPDYIYAWPFPDIDRADPKAAM